MFNAIQVDEYKSPSSHPEPVQALPISDQQEAYPFTIDLLSKQTNDEYNGDEDNRNQEGTIEAINVDLGNDLPLLLINDQLLILDDQSRNNKVRVHFFLKEILKYYVIFYYGV